MDIGALGLRVIHIVCGVYWAGALIFIATFLQPSIRDAGPDGATVMQNIMKRRFLDVMPVVALLTILTGFELYRRVSAGFNPDWIRSGQGMSLTIGAVSALVAFAIGVGVMRPTARRMGPTAQAAQQAPEGPERDARMAELQGLRARAATAGRWVAIFLTVAVVGMAAARYL